MKTITENIRQIATKILEQGRVERVIGFQKGSLGTQSRPFSAKSPEDADLLIFDCNCRMNLTAYLTPATGRTGIVVKGCDSRNLVTHIIENRVRREDLYIIGVPCTGLAGRAGLIQAAGSDILSVEDQGEYLILETKTGKKQVERTEVLQSNCRTCIQRNPVIFDELAGPRVEELTITNRFSDVEHIDTLSPDKKEVFFKDLFQSCTRCYACRNACPLCYCPTCFVDESRPQWVGRTIDPVDVSTYHLLRAFHDAGRCTDCGACEAACPMDINMRLLTRKMIKDCVERYGWEAGMSLEDRPALDRFKIDDPEGFIR